METDQHVFQHGKAAEKDILLENPGYTPLCSPVRWKPGNILALEDYLASGRQEAASNHIEGGGLAGTIGANQPQYHSRLNIQVKVSNGCQTAKALGQIADFNQ